MGFFGELFHGHKKDETQPGTDAMGNNPSQMAELQQMRDKQAMKQVTRQDARVQALQENADEAGVVQASAPEIQARVDELTPKSTNAPGAATPPADANQAASPEAPESTDQSNAA